MTKKSKKLNISSKARKVIWTEMPKITDCIWLTRIIPSARSYSFIHPVLFFRYFKMQIRASWGCMNYSHSLLPVITFTERSQLFSLQLNRNRNACWLQGMHDDTCSGLLICDGWTYNHIKVAWVLVRGQLRTRRTCKMQHPISNHMIRYIIITMKRDTHMLLICWWAW